MISFQEFNRFLVDTIERELPGCVFYIVNGGDCIQDVVMEIRVQGKRLQYKPYELYVSGCEEDDYEERVYELIKKLT